MSGFVRGVCSSSCSCLSCHTHSFSLSVSLLCFNGPTFFPFTLAQTVNQPDRRENMTVLSHSLAWHTPTWFSPLCVSFSCLLPSSNTPLSGRNLETETRWEPTGFFRRTWISMAIVVLSFDIVYTSTMSVLFLSTVFDAILGENMWFWRLVDILTELIGELNYHSWHASC